jgi:hypothetical protein
MTSDPLDSPSMRERLAGLRAALEAEPFAVAVAPASEVAPDPEQRS